MYASGYSNIVGFPQPNKRTVYGSEYTYISNNTLWDTLKKTAKAKCVVGDVSRSNVDSMLFTEKNNYVVATTEPTSCVAPYIKFTKSKTESLLVTVIIPHAPAYLNYRMVLFDDKSTNTVEFIENPDISVVFDLTCRQSTVYSWLLSIPIPRGDLFKTPANTLLTRHQIHLFTTDLSFNKTFMRHMLSMTRSLPQLRCEDEKRCLKWMNTAGECDSSAALPSSGSVVLTTFNYSKDIKHAVLAKAVNILYTSLSKNNPGDVTISMVEIVSSALIETMQMHNVHSQEHRNRDMITRVRKQSTWKELECELNKMLEVLSRADTREDIAMSFFLQTVLERTNVLFNEAHGFLGKYSQALTGVMVTLTSGYQSAVQSKFITFPYEYQRDLDTMRLKLQSYILSAGNGVNSVVTTTLNDKISEIFRLETCNSCLYDVFTYLEYHRSTLPQLAASGEVLCFAPNTIPQSLAKDKVVAKALKWMYDMKQEMAKDLDVQFSSYKEFAEHSPHIKSIARWPLKQLLQLHTFHNKAYRLHAVSVENEFKAMKNDLCTSEKMVTTPVHAEQEFMDYTTDKEEVHRMYLVKIVHLHRGLPPGVIHLCDHPIRHNHVYSTHAESSIVRSTFSTYEMLNSFINDESDESLRLYKIVEIAIHKLTSGFLDQDSVYWSIDNVFFNTCKDILVVAKLLETKTDWSDEHALRIFPEKWVSTMQQCSGMSKEDFRSNYESDIKRMWCFDYPNPSQSAGRSPPTLNDRGTWSIPYVPEYIDGDAICSSPAYIQKLFQWWNKTVVRPYKERVEVPLQKAIDGMATFMRDIETVAADLQHKSIHKLVDFVLGNYKKSPVSSDEPACNADRNTDTKLVDKESYWWNVVEYMSHRVPVFENIIKSMYHDDGGAYIGRTSSHAKLFFHVMAGSTVRDKMPDIYIPSRDVESHLDPSSVDDENAFYELLIRALSSKITEINAKQQACESDFLGYVQQALSEKIYIEQNRVFNEFDSKRMIYNSIPYPSFDINLTGTQSFHVRTSPEVYKDLDDHKKKELNKACEGIKMIAVLGESAKEAGASLRDMRERIATNNGYRSSEYIVADKKRLRFEQVPNTYTGATNTAAVSDYFLTYLVDTLLLNGTTVGDILSILSTNSAADKSNPVISHTEEMFNEENARNAVNASFCPSNELTSEHRATYVAVGQMAVNAPNSYVPIFQPNERPCIAAASADQIILFYNIHAPTARTVSPCAIVANEDATNRKNEMFIMSSSMDDEEAIRLIIGELFQYLPEKRVSLDIFRTMTTPDFWKNTYVDAMAAIRDKWLDIAATSILFQIQQRQEHIHDSMLRGAAIRNSLQYARYNNHRIENGSDVRINLLLPIRQADVIGAFDGRESIMIGMSTPMNSLVDINSGAVEYDDEDNNVGMLIEEVGDWQLQNPTLFTMYTSPYNDEYCNSLTEEIFNDMQCLKEHGAKMKEPMPTFLPHPPFQSTSRTATGSDFDDVLTKLSLKQKLARGEQISGVEPSTMKFVQDLWGNDDYRRHIKDSSSSDDEVTTVLEEENNDPSLNLCRRISQEPLSSEKAECYDGAIATRVRVFVNDLDYMQDVNQELLELKDKFATVFISTTL